MPTEYRISYYAIRFETCVYSGKCLSMDESVRLDFCCYKKVGNLAIIPVQGVSSSPVPVRVKCQYWCSNVAHCPMSPRADGCNQGPTNDQHDSPRPDTISTYTHTAYGSAPNSMLFFLVQMGLFRRKESVYLSKLYWAMAATNCASPTT